MINSNKIWGNFFRFICIITVIAMFFFALPETVLAAGEADTQPTQGNIIVPLCGIFFNDHTYVIYQIPNLTWQEQKEFCERLGATAGVDAHLAIITSKEENDAIRKMRPYATIGAYESGGVWRWLDGTVFGRQVHAPNADGEDDFIYIPEGYDDWCTTVHGDPHSGQQMREPDSFVPYLGECYANFNADLGWHNGKEDIGSQFICEFEGRVNFIYADLNFDQDFSAPTALWASNQVYPGTPGIYEYIYGYTVVKPMKKLPRKLEKQPGMNYPVHPGNHWNFRGWSYKSDTGKNELFGCSTGADKQEIWNYNSLDLPNICEDEPVLVLHAVWENANNAWKDGPDSAIDESRYLALCLAAGIMGYTPQDAYSGKTVSEVMNDLYAASQSSSNESFKEDLNEQLAKVRDIDKNPYITVLDFIHASIGGWIVDKWNSGAVDTPESERVDSGWSFFAIRLRNTAGKNAIAYRGTEFSSTDIGKDTMVTDLQFGVLGRLDSAFDRAVRFFKDNHDDQTFVVGHSMGGSLASHVAMTEGVKSYTINSAEGWTIPLTVQQNYLTREFAGNDTLENSLRPYIRLGDSIGTHARLTRTRLEITAKDQCGFNDHKIGSTLSYDSETGLYSIIKPTLVKYHEAWEALVGVPSPLPFPVPNKSIYLGTSGKDFYYHFYEDKLSTGYYDVPNSLMYNTLAFSSDNFVFGGDGDDTLITGYGQDTLIGGKGTNLLDGGLGPDTYIIRQNPGKTTYIYDPDGPHTLNSVYVVNLAIKELPSVENGCTMILSDGQRVIFDRRALYNTSIYLCHIADDAVLSTDLPRLTVAQAALPYTGSQIEPYSFFMKDSAVTVELYDRYGNLLGSYKGDQDQTVYKDYGYIYTGAGKGVQIILFDSDVFIRIPMDDKTPVKNFAVFTNNPGDGSPLTEYQPAKILGDYGFFNSLEISFVPEKGPVFEWINTVTNDRWEITPRTFEHGMSKDNAEKPDPTPLTAAPTASQVLVNGKPVDFQAYNIGGNNYFKLRDLAYILSGTEKQFEVGWDNETKSILLTSGKPYTVIGGEMENKGVGDKKPTPTTSTIFIDGIGIPFTAYNIDGNNYFKLRDVGSIFDFDVTWDGAKNSIVIDTSAVYTPD